MGIGGMAGPTAGKLELVGAPDGPVGAGALLPPQLTKMASRSQPTDLMAMEITVQRYRFLSQVQAAIGAVEHRAGTGGVRFGILGKLVIERDQAALAG